VRTYMKDDAFIPSSCFNVPYSSPSPVGLASVLTSFGEPTPKVEEVELTELMLAKQDFLIRTRTLNVKVRV